MTLRQAYLQRPWLRVLLVTVAVAVVSALMLVFTRTTTEIAIIWPTNAMVMGIVVMTARRLGLNIMAGAIAATWLSSIAMRDNVYVGAGLALAHTVEIVVAWLAIQLYSKEFPNLGNPRVLWPFTLYGVFVGPAISGAVAAAVLETTGGASWWQAFQIWWAAHALGMALFAPMVVAFHPKSWERTRALLKRPILGPWLGLVGVTTLVFSQTKYPVLFMLFPPLMWLVFRWGFSGACLGAMTALAIAFPLTYHGDGPMMLLANNSMANRLFFLQILMGTALLVMFPIGMILDQRERLMGRLRAREADLERMAWHDPLTGLLNRRGFDEHWQAMATGQWVSIVVLDLDHFKGYNDSYGHPEGDACLVWLSYRLRLHAETAGGVAGRQGGEEFSAALPMAPAQALAWAEAFRADIDQAQRPHIASFMGHVTVSMGVASMQTREPEDLEMLWRQADRALYQAKQNGRNQVVEASG
jgi:diguanylate cyclase (GGDEF)-like protein